MTAKPVLIRFVVWVLASMSFACLLGHFYGFWSMHAFAPCVLVPATLALVGIAWRMPGEVRRLIVEGAVGGLFAAVVYDLYRVPFVLAGKPLFAVFPKFGQMLLGAPDKDISLVVQITGWLYHFSNGAALGIMFLAMIPLSMSLRARMGAAAAWAVTVEILLLLSPYYAFFKLKLPMSEFLWLTLSAHVVFGLALGWYTGKRFRVDQLRTS